MFTGGDWLATKPPTNPLHNKNIAKLCHSERSEESNIFLRQLLLFFGSPDEVILCQSVHYSISFIFSLKTPINALGVNNTTLNEITQKNTMKRIDKA